VKPDNILLDRDGDRALVTDFGIASAVGHDTPVDGVALGTPAYMSPEQGRGEDATPQSDLYALGVTAWMAVTGRTPFPGPDAMSYVVQHASMRAPSLASARAGLPDALVRAVDACLAKLPAERWESAEALAVVLADERSRVPAVPAPVRAFVREWERVGAEVATAGTAAGVSAVLGLILMALPRASFTASILSAVYLLIAGLVGTLAAERIAQLGVHARLLLRSGYDTRALASAMRRELPARVEEVGSAGATRTRVTLVTSLAALGVGAASTWGLWQETGDFTTIVLAALSVVSPTVAVRALWSHSQRKSPEGLWNRLASGWLGRAIFRVAGIGVPPVGANAVEGGEATVLAVGERTRLAYAALPAPQRSLLGDVPALVQRLEREALQLRSAAPTPIGQTRLEEVMAALELLRLDLLRAATAPDGPSGLTSAIERVREVGRRVDAIADVERLTVVREMRPEVD
jgi:serine/threonine-protein kinase